MGVGELLSGDIRDMDSTFPASHEETVHRASSAVTSIAAPRSRQLADCLLVANCSSHAWQFNEAASAGKILAPAKTLEEMHRVVLNITLMRRSQLCSLWWCLQ